MVYKVRKVAINPNFIGKNGVLYEKVYLLKRLEKRDFL